MMKAMFGSAVLALGLAWGGAAALAKPVPRYEATPCPMNLTGVSVKVDCGQLVVPETRGLANGRTVVVPVAIARSPNPAKNPVPVLYLHGGPGGSVLPRLGNILRNKDMGGAKLADRDWIFFDQRGSGLSVPLLECGDIDLTDSGLVSDQDVSRATACAQRLAAAGIDLSQFDNAAIADDVADLRTALGIERWALYGVSYGARVAAVILRDQPAGVTAAVLDSPYPTEAKGTERLPGLVSRDVRKVLAKCAADRACARRVGDVLPAFEAFARSILAQPITTDGTTFRAEDVASYLLEALYSQSGTRRLPVTLWELTRGDFSRLKAHLSERSYYVEGQNLSHFCREELPFESETAMRAAAEGDPIAEVVVTTAARYFEACKTWPVGTPDPIEAQPLRSAVPILFVTAEIDAGCPTDYAREALPTLSNAQVVEVPNATHGLFRVSRCARSFITAFLANPGRPLDTSCLATEHARLPFDLARR
jgi:pimeloyl-ACP methyl ester carboxylesterase